jgi:hypothetical protein
MPLFQKKRMPVPEFCDKCGARLVVRIYTVPMGHDPATGVRQPDHHQAGLDCPVAGSHGGHLLNRLAAGGYALTPEMEAARVKAHQMNEASSRK